MAKDVNEGLEKSALLLLTLGGDEAAEVLKHLSPREVQKLGAGMAKMTPQPRERVEKLLEELQMHAARGSHIEPDEEAIRTMLTKALGDERAANLISRVLQGSDTAGIESLKWMDAATAALFPDSFEESELGLVPSGWKVGKVENLMTLSYGKALKATDRIDGSVPVYGSGGITGYHNETLVKGPSVIVGRKGTVGSLYWEDRPFFPIDTVFYVRTDKPLTYCYYLLQTLGLEDMNTDGAVPGLNRNNAYRLPLVVATTSILESFDEIVSSLRNKMFSNSQHVQNLTQLRDTLLPRLISGQLRLPETATTIENILSEAV